MKAIKICAMTAAFAVATLPAMAQDDMGTVTPMLGEGTQEILLNGGIDFDSADGTIIDLGLGYGKFVADCLEVGGLLTYADSDSITIYGIGGFAEYHWDLGTAAVPYVGAGLSWAQTELEVQVNGPVGPVFVDADEDVLLVNVGPGLKYYISPNFALDFSLHYTWASEDIFDEDDGQLEDSEITLSWGVRATI